MYNLTSRNWHILHTVPLQTISTTALERDVHYFGEAQIHDPRGTARFWPDTTRALKHHLEPQIIPRPYILELKQAIISNFTVAEIANPDSVPIEIFPETMRSREHIHFMDKTKKQRRSLARRHRNRAPDHECGYLFGSIGWQNYYHTLVDHAVRYAEFKAAGQIPKEAVIVLPQTPNRYQAAFLDLLAIPPEKRVVADKTCIKFSRLVLPSMRRHGRAVSRAGLEAFRVQALSQLPDQPNKRSRRIYLSRRNAQTRRVLNELEVETVLHSHGFETAQTDQMNLIEQIALFSKAEIIVGPHGAGLANMVFAKAPRVIEFLPSDLWDLGYFIGLNASCGGSYSGIVFDGTSPNDDMTVDIDALRASIAG
ncbi:MAG: DUF563 domain-containing protein [Rhodothermales bacterium]